MSPSDMSQLIIAERQAHTRLTYLLRVYGSSGVALEKVDDAYRVWRELAAEVKTKGEDHG